MSMFVRPKWTEALRPSTLGLVGYLAFAIVPLALQGQTAEELSYFTTVVDATAAAEMGVYQNVALLCLFIFFIPCIYSSLSATFKDEANFLILIGIILVQTAIVVGFIFSDGGFYQITSVVLTAVALVGGLCFWRTPKRQVESTLYFGAIATTTFLVFALVFNGGVSSRWVGALHPNFFARAAWVAMAFYMMATRKFSWQAFVGCIAAAIIVSSRTPLVAAAGFLVVYLAQGTYTSRQMVRALFVVLFAVLAISVDLFLGGETTANLGNTLDLNSEYRGVSSGMSGRDQSWTDFYDNLHEFGWSGYGFRGTPYTNLTAHSGFLSYFFDFGLLLGGVVYGAILIRVWRLIKHSHLAGDKRGILLGALSIGNLMYQVSEPDNLYLGVPGSIIFLLGITYPIPKITKMPQVKPQPRQSPAMTKAAAEQAPAGPRTAGRPWPAQRGELGNPDGRA